MNNKITLLLLLLIPVCLWNCSRETVPEEYYTVEVIEGVRHIHNYKPQWGDEPKVALEFVQQIGEFEATDDNYLFFQPRDIALDGEGNLYVLDAGNYRIQKFNTQGKFLASFGRKGEGPSEFDMPFAIDIDSKGNIYVYDVMMSTRYSPSRIIVLDAQGKEIKRFSYEDENGISFLRILNSKEMVRRLLPESEASDLIGIYNTNGKKLREFVEPKIYEDEAFNTIGNSFDYSVDKNTNIYVCFEHQNRIEKYSAEGELLMNTDRPLDFEITHKKEKQVMDVYNNKGGLTPREIERGRISYVSEGLGVDHKGRIWTITWRRQGEEDDREKYPDPYVLAAELFRFDIFDPEGIFLGSLPVEKYFGSMHIYDDRLFLVDAYNEMCVYEYKIVEK